MKTLRLTQVGLLAACVCAMGCGDALGPVDSIPMTLTINSMNASDIDSPGLIEKDENISNGTNNPWGEFIKTAEDRCSATPRGFEVLSASLALDVPGSSDVQVLEDVISGEATVYFISTQGSDAVAERVNVASGSGIVGAGPVNLSVVASRAQLDALFERMLGGDFHVGLRAQTERTEEDSFSMDAMVTFQARALCS